MSKVDEIKGQILAGLDTLDAKLLAYPAVQLAQEKTNIRPAFMAVAVSTLLLLLSMFQLGSHALCQLIGFLYPLYASYQAVKSPDPSDDGFWLTYWIIYSLFTLVESLTDLLLNSVPFGLYWVSKVIFLIWCFLPMTKGAKLIYDRVIDPILRRYEDRIDAAASRFDKGATRLAGDFKHEAGEAGRQAAGAAQRKVIQSVMEGGHVADEGTRYRGTSATNVQPEHEHAPQAPTM